jgi:hypothetical protein
MARSRTHAGCMTDQRDAMITVRLSDSEKEKKVLEVDREAWSTRLTRTRHFVGRGRARQIIEKVTACVSQAANRPVMR